MDNPEDTLQLGEFHPSASDAMFWLKEFQIKNFKEWAMIRESIASTALSGDRLSNVMHGTLERLSKGEPVSDRYLLGLCWYLIRNHSTKTK
jgi:hypothetical protein